MFKLRFFWVLLKSIFSRGLQTKSKLGFWVTPLDCDLNLHLNNGYYLKFMDLGRWDLILRMRMMRTLLQHDFRPVAVRVEIDFKKALPPGSYFTLETQFESKTSRSVTLRQVFKRGHEISAIGLVTAVFLHKGRPINMDRFVELIPPTFSALDLSP